jgi:hypothetical protein
MYWKTRYPFDHGWPVSRVAIGESVPASEDPCAQSNPIRESGAVSSGTKTLDRSIQKNHALFLHPFAA